MRTVALILLIGVFIRHDAVRLLAQLTGATPAEVFYILGGAWEFSLCGVILLLSWHMRECRWKRIIQAAMVIGMIEGTQVSVCRMAIHDIHAVPSGVDLCDYATHLPMGSVVMSLYFLIFVWSLGRAPRTP